MAIPPGVSSRDWQTALRQFAQAVGEAWVLTSDEDIALYRDAYSPLWGEPDERLVSAAVAPDSTEQVSEVVRVANRFRIPVYPISTGKNLGYGGSAPNLSGSVVVDLKRMNRVIEVDDRRHFAIVEPGVAYFDLYREGVDRLSRSGMGQPRRKRTGPRCRLYIRGLPRPLPLALRARSRVAERRRRSHRHGRTPWRQHVG
jgi:hypothetical protein